MSSRRRCARSGDQRSESTRSSVSTATAASAIWAAPSLAGWCAEEQGVGGLAQAALLGGVQLGGTHVAERLDHTAVGGGSVAGHAHEGPPAPPGPQSRLPAGRVASAIAARATGLAAQLTARACVEEGWARAGLQRARSGSDAAGIRVPGRGAGHGRWWGLFSSVLADAEQVAGQPAGRSPTPAAAAAAAGASARRSPPSDRFDFHLFGAFALTSYRHAAPELFTSQWRSGTPPSCDLR